MEQRKKQWLLLYLLIIIAFLSFIFTFPAVPVSFKFAGREINKTFTGPDINFQIYGKKFFKEVNLKLGPDIGGGTRFVLHGDVSNIPEGERDSALENAKEIIEERSHFFNLTEPRIYTSRTENDYRVVLELAKESNSELAAAIASQNAKLELKEIKEEFKNSTDPNAMYDPNSYTDSVISNFDIVGTSLQNNPNTGDPIIKLQLTYDGKNKFSELSVRNAGGFIAIFLDDSIIAFQGISPEVRAETAGMPIISGNFTSDQARMLGMLIDSGSLPFPIKVEDIKSIGTRFDSDSINAGTALLLSGFFILMVFLIYKYKVLGLIADLALIINSMFLLTIYKLGVPALFLWIFTGNFAKEILIPVTLTFNGILGVLLSLLIFISISIYTFERMRLERRQGEPLIEAISKSFKQTGLSMGSLCVLILTICFILGQFGTGQARNFAITLSSGVLVGLFTTLTLLKTLVTLFYRKKES